MIKPALKNDTTDQALDTVNFAKHMNQSISAQKLQGVLDNERVANAPKVIISGCGDSWLAGIAAKPVFEAMTDKEVEVMRSIELSRYMDSKKFGGEHPPVVFFISISGGVSRVVEGAKRATLHGATTIAVTQNTDSPLALACTHVLPLDMLPIVHTPGVSSYIASTMALMNSAMYIGKMTNQISGDLFETYKQDLLDYCVSYDSVMCTLDCHMANLAARWQDMKAWDFVGDYADWATAFFAGAKMVESFGAIMTCDDSEDWNHINAFVLEPQKMATMFIANEKSPSFNRVVETMQVAAALGRAAVVVTDADPAKIPAGIEVIAVPKSKHGWEAPIMQHLPADILCGYVGALKHQEGYRKNLPEVFGGDTWQNRLKTGTEIKVL